ncbi:MAG: universal stress protein [Oscillochloris sp.]|nr:universal stress protein [Oscillochloris sp.]
MKTILVPLDGSPFGEHALPAALTVARKGAARIELVHVHQIIAPTLSPNSAPFFDPAIDREIRDQETAYLKDVAKRIAAVWDGSVSQALLNTPVADAICNHAQETGADLIVLSTHGRGGIARAWLGSVADRVIHQSKIATLVIPPNVEPLDLDHELELDRVLIPLDGSPLAEHAIALAEQVMGTTTGRYHLVRVVEPMMHGLKLDGVESSINVNAQEIVWKHASYYLDRVAGSLREQGHTVMTYVPIGHSASAILERARADAINLIVMTTHGRSGMTRMLMGSVADKVLRGSMIPLLIQRPPTMDIETM